MRRTLQSANVAQINDLSKSCNRPDIKNRSFLTWKRGGRPSIPTFDSVITVRVKSMWLLALLVLGCECHFQHHSVRISSFAQNMPKFVSQLVIPAKFSPSGNNYTVWMSEFFSQILPPGYPATKVWGYGGMTNQGMIASYPGPTFEVAKDQEVFVTFVNNISTPHLFAVDPTLHWANPNRVSPPSKQTGACVWFFFFLM